MRPGGKGLTAFAFRGGLYLGIANEVRASAATATHTTLYRIDRAKH